MLIFVLIGRQIPIRKSLWQSCRNLFSEVLNSSVQEIKPDINVEMEAFQRVKHVVVDSGAFIKNASIQTIGENIYTLPDVVEEIRDRATRDRLQVLPYTPQFKDPPVEAIRFVTDFSKKTGDYRSLSATDLKVVALTYQLEKELTGAEHIRQSPQKRGELITAKRLLENPAQIAGFYLDKRAGKKAPVKTESEQNPESVRPEVTPESLAERVRSETEDVVLQPLQQLGLSGSDTPQGGGSQSSQNTESSSAVDSETLCEDVSDVGSSERWPTEGGTLGAELLEEGGISDEEGGSSDEEGGSSDEGEEDGWITPSNIKAMKERLGEVTTETAGVTVGCLTTDFAMQNVMIQMGLNVISLHGMLIKRAKSYSLRCFACMKITSIMTRQFCPHCGNDTLQRVSMTVDQDGSVRYFLSRRKPVTTRGLRYSLPTPKGGKHGNNPILCEDQPCPQQRTAKKTQHSLNVFDPDYIANQSPFALNDTTSRAAQLGIRQKGAWNKRNPNAGKKKIGRRK